MQRRHLENNMTAVVCEPSQKHDIYVVDIGHSTPPPGYRVFNRISCDYSFHFVIRGKGLYNKQNIDSGCGFVIAAGEPYAFEFDAVDPWEHCWIGLNGRRCAETLENMGISVRSHVFRCDWLSHFLDEFNHCLFDDMPGVDYPMYLLGLFYRMMAYYPSRNPMLPVEHSTVERYFNAAVRYIEEHYPRSISVEDAAGAAGISSQYLYKIFMQHAGISPNVYIARYRLNRARSLLSDTTLSVEEIAHVVGYQQANYFTNSFRRLFGESPTAYRKRILP